MKRTLFFASLAVLFVSPSARAQQDAWTSPLTIKLVQEVSVDTAIVSLDQIARITGSTLDFRRKIGKLDVAEFKLLANRIWISEDQVKYRLLLAGLKLNDFSIIGARRVTVLESDDPITIRKIRACAESALLQKYPGDSSNITIGMNQEFTVPLVYARPSDRVQFEGKAGPHLPMAGKSRVDVSIIINGRTREIVPVVLDVYTPDAPVVNADNIVKAGIAPIRPVADSMPAKQEPVLVKTNNLVKMIARIGMIRIETVGEAMQEGKLNETIRVRNLESNRVVPGRVAAPGVVEVDY